MPSCVSVCRIPLPSAATGQSDALESLHIDVRDDATAWTQTRQPPSRTTAAARFCLIVVVKGVLAFSQHGTRGSVGARSYVLLDEGAAHRLSGEAGTRIVTVSMSAHALTSQLLSVRDHLLGRFPADREMAAVLSAFLESIVDLFAMRTPPRAHVLARQIVNLVTLTLSCENRDDVVDVRGGRYLLRRRIIDRIDGHLDDDTLSPEKIARGCGISVSYLYSLLRDDNTTFGKLIQAKRLERAYDLLASDFRGHRTVAEVAYQVGFKNVSHFSRSFSRHFNLAPRDIRNAGAGAAAS